MVVYVLFRLLWTNAKLTGLILTVKKRLDWKQKRIKELKMSDWGSKRNEEGENRKQNERSNRPGRNNNYNSIMETLRPCLSKIQIPMIVSRESRKKYEKHIHNSGKRNNTNVDITPKANSLKSNPMKVLNHSNHHQITKKKYKRNRKKIKGNVGSKNNKQEQCVKRFKEWKLKIRIRNKDW